MDSLSSRGSVWYRWDPHLHAPGTLLNDQFGGDWNAYIARINSSSPAIRALGVTDYFCIRGYRAVRQMWKGGELKNVDFVFPNVEMRLDIKTDKQIPINLHLLFSPDDQDHAEQIERILGHLVYDYDGVRYQCTTAQLAALGRAVVSDGLDETAALRVGAQQFKVQLGDVRQLFSTEKWLARNCLVAVAGSSNDGTSGLQADDSYVATRREIERFADIIFSATPSQRRFWIGEHPDVPPQIIEKTYRSLKPCLHGSDGHSPATTASPNLNRYCWIKGDRCFDTLRQVVLEPKRRVFIGEKPNVDGGGLGSIAGMEVEHAPWLTDHVVAFNTGLVAIIGSRGSGKSALVEMIAHAAGCSGASLADSSFLSKAREHLAGGTVRLTWADDESPPAARLSVPNEDMDWLDADRVRYLSQEFVEKLCSGPGLAVGLRREIERIVFDATEVPRRLQAASFEELVSLMDEPILKRRADLRSQLDEFTQEVVKEDRLIAGLPELKGEKTRQSNILDNARKDLAKLMPKDTLKHSRRLAELETALSTMELKIERQRRRGTSLTDLLAEVKAYGSTGAAAQLQHLRGRYAEAQLTREQWDRLLLRYGDEVEGMISNEIAAVDREVDTSKNGRAGVAIDKDRVPLDLWPLVLVEAERNACRALVGIDVDKQRRYGVLQKEISRLEGVLMRLETQIASSEGAPGRRQNYLETRRVIYQKIFETFSEEETTLNELYAPIKSQLVDGKGALRKLQFVVERRVTLSPWIDAGEALLDLRKATIFRGEGALGAIVEQEILPSWRKGTPADVSNAIQAFIEKYRKELMSAMPGSITPQKRGAWIQQVAAWLYDTSHVDMQYSLRYDGVAIEKLSPGTRGIVLLLLYLVLDRSDLRPLVIDQPEENLDPQSILEELVPHFREARERRQVIIVTHNANLVVNADADQVIIATSTPSESEGLPRISYLGGSLESREIRERVCAILEGGERAFMDRAKRYRFILK